MKTGERLGPYEIVDLIGKGGMGEVYKARDTRLGRDVAIKVSSERFTERFQREARAVAALNHPHICTLHDVGPNYLVMEFLEGAPLKGPLPEAEALRLASQIADALETAHAKGIIHRDLKPGNILVTRFGAKLLDFGLAKQSPSALADDEATLTLTEAGAVVGTASYMSPEQAQGQSIDARSDVFSFGLVLYEMLSGRRAFSGDTTLAVLAAILTRDPEPVEAPAVLTRVVTRCLRKSPEERYESMKEVKAALSEAAASPRAEQPSIAVLPFANLSSDKENEYFSDGLAEEVLNALTQLPGLRVVARASTFSFRGRENAIKEIGDTLKVSSVLHGSVRRSGNRIRVSAQLIKVIDESQLWSERYDREMRDVFDIQDEIAQAIVSKLKVQLGARAGQPLVKRYTESPEAHSLYLKGNFHLYRFTPEEMEKGRTYLEQAVAREPGHAPAWLQLADFYIAGCIFGAAHPNVMWPKAREAVQKAVAADPDFADAQAALGFVMAMSEHKFREACDRFDTAIRLNPSSARTLFWRSQIIKVMGRDREAWENAQRAVDLDPLFVLYRLIIGQYYMRIGAYEQAAEHARQILEIDPNYAFAICLLGESYLRTNRYEEAIALMEQAAQGAARGYYPTGRLSQAYVAAGRRSDAERYLAGLEEKRRKSHVPAATLALATLGLGNVDGTWNWIEQAVADRDPNLLFVIAERDLDPLRSDPRYQSLMRRMNLA